MQENIVMRWLTRADLDEVVKLDRKCMKSDVDVRKYLSSVLAERNTIGMVILYNDVLAGYIIYSLHKNTLKIDRVVIDEEFKGKGLGTFIISRLKNKLNNKRTKISIIVPDSHFHTHMLLKRNDFIAVKVLKEYYVVDDEYMDGYLFEYEDTVLSKTP